MAGRAAPGLNAHPTGSSTQNPTGRDPVLLPEAGGLVLGPSQGSHPVGTGFGQGAGAEESRN